LSTVRISDVRPDPVRRSALKVFVRGLRIDAHIGIYAHEHGRTQPLVVDVELELGSQRVEGLTDTVDYETVVTRARAAASLGHVDLVEEYAEILARACLEDPRVHRVHVRVEKPEALSAADAAGCEVELHRG
jgi:dihydroneopterin aldolase